MCTCGWGETNTLETLRVGLLLQQPASSTLPSSRALIQSTFLFGISSVVRKVPARRQDTWQKAMLVKEALPEDRGGT